MKDPTKRPLLTRVVRFELAPRSIVAVIFTLGLLWVLGKLVPVIVVVLCALILVGTLNPLVNRLEDRRIKRVWAVAIVFGTLLGLVALVALFMLPALFNQVGQLISNFPVLQTKLSAILSANRATAPLAEAVRNYGMRRATTHAVATSAVAVSLSVIEILGYAGTVVVLAIYFIADYEGVRGAFYAVVPRSYHVRLARILLNLEPIVGGYMRGQLITSVAMALFTFSLLAICRVPNALSLAAFAGLTDVIPFVGGLLATTPAVISALSRGTLVVGIVVVAMAAYQEFESRIIVPWVYGNALRLAPAVVILALLIGGSLGGIIGALLALPLAAAARMLFEELRFELPGDDSDDTALRRRDSQAERAYAAQSAGASPTEASMVATQIADQIAKSESSDPTQAMATPLTDGEDK